MLKSCHFVGLLTSSYLATPWCDLEYLGFKNIRSANPIRNLILCKPDVHLQVPDMYAVCDALLMTSEEAAGHIRDLVQEERLRLGDDVFPPTCFGDLPLEDVHHAYHFWDNSEQGNHIEPPRRIAVALVRELMIRLRKGATEAQLLQDLEQQNSRLARLASNALEFARELLRRGVPPETPPGSYEVPTDPEFWRDRPSPPAASAGKAPAPPVPGSNVEPVWAISWVGESRHTLEGTCQGCGYTEVFYPLDGDRPHAKCPKCGFDGTPNLLT